MARAFWLADALRDTGIPFAEIPGWRERGLEGLDPIAVFGHHIGIPGPDNGAGLRIVTHGREGLRNSLSNLHLSRAGVVSLVAAGLCWHAGAGSHPRARGNRDVGIEAEGTTGEPMDAPQFDAFVALVAAAQAGLTKYVGVVAPHFLTHHEWRAEKPDAWGVLHAPGGVDGFRYRVAHHRPPSTPEEALAMGKYVAAHLVPGNLGPWPNGRWQFAALTADGRLDFFNTLDSTLHRGDRSGTGAEDHPMIDFFWLFDAAGKLSGYVLVAEDGGCFNYGSGVPIGIAA